MRVQRWGQTHEHRRHFCVLVCFVLLQQFPSMLFCQQQAPGIDNDEANTTTYQCRRQRSGHYKLKDQTSERARRRKRTRQEESSCFAFLKVGVFLTIGTQRQTHIQTHTGVSISVLYLCVAKTSRVLLLFIHQQTRERAEMICERTHPSLGEAVQDSAVTWQSRTASHRSAISSDTRRQSLDWRVTND